MKKILCICLCLLLLPLSALAGGSDYGTLVCRESHAVLSPYGGILRNISVQKGQLIHQGDAICTLQTTKVYSPVDGTVSIIFAQPGDSLEEVKSRCGCVLAIVPEHSQLVNATTQRGARNSENRLYVGQTLTLSGSKKGSKGRGRVTAIDSGEESEGGFTVEVQEGSFYPGETVTVYTDEACSANCKLGSGVASASSAVQLNGEGSLLRLCVEEGSSVQRGDLLYETVSGTLDGLLPADSTVLSPEDGIVAACELTDGSAVEKNAVLITIYPLNRMQVSLTVSETELASYEPGRKVQLKFEWNGSSFEGSVAAILYLNESTENSTALSYAQYQVLIDFPADESCRIGMLVAVNPL